MKKLDRYIIFLFIGPFFITFTIILFVFVMQFLWLYIDDIIGKGLSIINIISLLSFMSASFVSMSLPLAVLLSSIMTFGGLSERYELSSMKAAGISLLRIISSLVFFIIVISIFSFFFSNKVVPYSNFKALNLLSNIRTQKPAMNIKEGIFDNSLDGFSIKIGKKNEDSLYNIIIYQTSNQKITTTIAKRGIMKKDHNLPFMTFNLFDGYSYENQNPNDNNEKLRQHQYSTYFTKQTIHFDLSSFNLKLNENNRTNEKSMLNNSQIYGGIEKTLTDLNSYLNREASFFISKFFNNNTDDTIKNINLINLLDSSFLYSNNKNNIIDNTINEIIDHKSYIVSEEKNISKFNTIINSSIMEIHRKYAFAFACIVMFFIGAPLGAVIKKGGIGLPIVLSVIIFIVYQILFMTTERMGSAGSLDPILSRWIAPLCLTPFGIWLTYKSALDSPLLDANKYFAPFYYIKDYIKKLKGKPLFYERKIKD